MNIFLTGATGFIGSYVVKRLLEAGHTIRATKRKESRMGLVNDITDKIEWIDADILDMRSIEESLENIDTIVHCAAVVSMDPRDRTLMKRVNIEGTSALVDAALEKKINHFVHISSIAALGKTRDKSLINEDTPWEESPDNTDYAISKHLAEREVWRGQAEGLNVTVLNPSVVLGGGYLEEGTNGFFARAINGNRFYPIGETGFVDVRDVAYFVEKTIALKPFGKRYILSSENVTYQNLMESIAIALDKKPPTVSIGKMMSRFIWRGDILKSWLLRTKRQVSKQTMIAAARVQGYDNMKSIETFSHEYIPMKRTIEETAIGYERAISEGEKYFRLSYSENL